MICRICGKEGFKTYKKTIKLSSGYSLTQKKAVKTKCIFCKSVFVNNYDWHKAKKNGYYYIINYNKEDFAKKVLEITNGKGVPVVYDGVGKDTLDGSIECLSIRGMMVSFGNASGPLSDINVPKVIQPKGLYLVRPSMQQYLSTREELDEASKAMFEKVSSGEINIKIFKKYKLEEIVEAHKDLEGRKILGPAVIVPN